MKQSSTEKMITAIYERGYVIHVMQQAVDRMWWYCDVRPIPGMVQGKRVAGEVRVARNFFTQACTFTEALTKAYDLVMDYKQVREHKEESSSEKKNSTPRVRPIDRRGGERAARRALRRRLRKRL